MPSLTLKNEKGEDLDVSSLASDKGVVFFLVPKADTRTCTAPNVQYKEISHHTVIARSRMHDSSVRFPRYLP